MPFYTVPSFYKPSGCGPAHLQGVKQCNPLSAIKKTFTKEIPLSPKLLPNALAQPIRRTRCLSDPCGRTQGENKGVWSEHSLLWCSSSWTDCSSLYYRAESANKKVNIRVNTYRKRVSCFPLSSTRVLKCKTCLTPFMTTTASSNYKCRNADQRKGKKAQPLLLTPQSTTHMHALFPPS